MRSRYIIVLTGAALLVAAPARAHVGASVAVAKFTAPNEPAVTHVDPNDTVDPFTFATADASYTIQWVDGDTDPTGRFTIYYLDHQPTFQVTVDEIEQGAATKVDDPINKAGGFFASCFCSPDMGVTCPTDVRDPNGNCGNKLVWNTSALPQGTYWLVAVNNDPPFHVYNSSGGPVRVAHGGTAAPAAVIVRPDGLGAWDKVYHLQWIAEGKAPLKFDLAYGLEDTGFANAPSADIATGLTVTPNADGTFGYDWDISALDNNKAYWVRLKTTDADGTSTFTDSHFAVTVFHSGGMVTPADMAMAPKKSGCDVGAGQAPSSSSGGATLLSAFAALAFAVYLARRAGTRG
ncbi:MAG: hypothetical protein JWN44_20 [Myxococcales bacterium]|nr:hypothetical protein [Myxococcales bacterium]